MLQAYTFWLNFTNIAVQNLDSPFRFVKNVEKSEHRLNMYSLNCISVFDLTTSSFLHAADSALHHGQFVSR